MPQESLTLTIFGRDYRIACTPEERADLVACARYVDAKMNDIRDTGKVMGADRVAVMAALQIAQELFSAKAGGGASLGEIKRRVRQRARAKAFSSLNRCAMRKVAGSHRGAIGTRLLNLNGARSDHPEPLVQDIGRAACAGNSLCRRHVPAHRPRPGTAGPLAATARRWPPGTG